MELSWRLGDVPELASLSRGERKRVHRAALRAYVWGAKGSAWTQLGYLLLPPILTAVCAGALSLPWIFRSQATPIWVIGAGCFVGASVASYLLWHLPIPHLRRMYSDFVQEPK